MRVIRFFLGFFFQRVVQLLMRVFLSIFSMFSIFTCLYIHVSCFGFNFSKALFGGWGDVKGGHFFDF